MSVHDRIFDTNMINRGIKQNGKQVTPVFQLYQHLTGSLSRWRDSQPAHTGIAQAGAGRMGNHQVPPSTTQVMPDITLYVPVRPIFRRDKITGPRIMSTRDKCTPYHTGKLAGNKHLHFSYLSET